MVAAGGEHCRYGGGGGASRCAAGAPGPNKLVFPEGYDKGVLYATVDRPDTKQYRELYGPEKARSRLESRHKPLYSF